MAESKTWWYRTEHFWLGWNVCAYNSQLLIFGVVSEYPYWQMTPLMKTYYLLHSAYWSQQLLVLALRLEKPRKDFAELVLHHIVTLWLIG